MRLFHFLRGLWLSASDRILSPPIPFSKCNQKSFVLDFLLPCMLPVCAVLHQAPSVAFVQLSQPLPSWSIKALNRNGALSIKDNAVFSFLFLFFISLRFYEFNITNGKKISAKTHFMQRYLQFSTQVPGSDIEFSLFNFIDIVSVTFRNLQLELPNKQHWPERSW